MINKLTVDQISTLWDFIKHAIDEALPPIASGYQYRLNNILSSLMAGSTECWAVYEKNEEDKKITLYAIILTMITTDVCSGTRHLYVYAMASFWEDAPRKIWREGLEGLVKYAKSKGCERLVGYTDLPSMEALFKRVGGSADYTLLNLPVESFDPRRI